MLEGTKISVTSIYKYVVPFGTPAPSAFVMGINIHRFMTNALGDQYAWLCWLVAIAGVIGMEGVGGLSSILVSRAYIKRRFDIMKLAIVAVIGYAAFVGIGIYTGDDSRALLVTVALTLLGYFVLALWDGMQTVKEEQADKLETLHAETELEKQRAATERAKARQTRNTNPDNLLLKNGNLPETFRPADWRKLPADERAKVKAMTTAEISQTYRVSERTARNWKAEATK
jgi:hypothetical protein